jgi:4-alpha-glucanotransferase
MNSATMSTHPLLARRSSGVLLHPTSLPGPHGSGDLGAEARHFLHWLAAAGQQLWQILPLHPAGAGDSPYQSVSAFAADPCLIDLHDLIDRGWLSWQPNPGFDHHHCEFDRVRPWRMARLHQAWEGFCQRHASACEDALAEFVHAQAHWLDDYALFMVLHDRYGGPWTSWPQAYAQREPSALAALRQEAAFELGFWHFVQWRFALQWQQLREHAHHHGVHLIGDAPIFVAHHSADVWAHPELFLLAADGTPDAVAGVPPDYFSATGQRWGNPLYRWDVMARDGYHWWQQRLQHLMTQVDLIRLDHFRGFESHWSIPASETTAINGEWQAGPGLAFFEAMNRALGPLPLIAEDLGIITPAVTALRDACGYPGMRILQFAFGGAADNPYLPHQYTPHSVAYTGTHDNDTSVGWWHHARPAEHQMARAYLGPQIDAEPHWTLMQAASQSVARTVIFPFQDVLGLDSSHRMNTPGLATGCWRWRFDWSQVNHLPAQRLRAMSEAHGRYTR